jgi:hypothetical protein
MRKDNEQGIVNYRKQTKAEKKFIALVYCQAAC